MKRRDQGISNAWSFLLGFVLLTIVVPGVLIGPARAVRLIASAVSTTVMQYSDPTTLPTERSHKLPVAELRSKEQELVLNDVHYPIELHGTERDEVLVHFTDAQSTPFGPYEQIALAPPRSADLLGGPLALWIAGRMGVPVAHKELIFLRRDGRDAGIHEATEVITSAFEQYRHISDGPVGIFRVLPEVARDATLDPWRSMEHWVTMDDADQQARGQLAELIGVLNDTLMTNADRRVSIDRLVDVDAFNRYHAAMHMLGVNEEATVRMALVMNPRTTKFYPVLAAAPLVPAGGDAVISRERDLLGERMMAISDWRVQRDRHVRQAIQELHASGLFQQRLDAFSETIGPSLTTAGRARRPLFSMQDPEHSAAALQWTAGDLRTRTTTYWDRLVPVLHDELGAATVNVP